MPFRMLTTARFYSPRARLGAALVGGAVYGAVAVGSLGAAMLLSSPALAQQQVQRIAAVVNDDVISLRDVQERLALMMVSSSIPNTPENRQKILPSVLRGLVDDQLRLQEAKRLKITVSDAEVDAAIRRIEKANKMAPGSLPATLQKAGLPITALEKQIRPQIAWAKATQASLRRNVSVQPEEIDATLAQLESMKGLPQRRVAELVIAIPDPSQDGQAQGLAQRLIEELKAGANFSNLAQQFSSSGSARRGGDLGWIGPGQLSPEIDDVIQALQPGQISQPVRTGNGLVLLMVSDIRQPGAGNVADTEFHLSQLYMPTHGGAAVAPAKRAELVQKARGVGNDCQAFSTLAEGANLPNSGDIGSLKLADLPPQIAQAVQGLGEGQMSAPIVLADAEVVVMVCERRDPNGLPSRQELTDRLERDKLERLADRRLRDLRRLALIDIRL